MSRSERPLERCDRREIAQKIGVSALLSFISVSPWWEKRRSSLARDAGKTGKVPLPLPFFHRRCYNSIVAMWPQGGYLAPLSEIRGKIAQVETW